MDRFSLDRAVELQLCLAYPGHQLAKATRDGGSREAVLA